MIQRLLLWAAFAMALVPLQAFASELDRDPVNTVQKGEVIVVKAKVGDPSSASIARLAAIPSKNKLAAAVANAQFEAIPTNHVVQTELDQERGASSWYWYCGPQYHTYVYWYGYTYYPQYNYYYGGYTYTYYWRRW